MDNFLDASERCAVHDNRKTGLFAQSTPAVYIVLHKWVFDVAYNRVIALQFLNDGKDRR